MKINKIKALKKAVYIACLTITSNYALAVDCTIPDYSADYTISAACDGLVLTGDFNHTLTVAADVTDSSYAFPLYTYDVRDLIINAGVTINGSSYPIYAKGDGTFNSIINNGTITASGGYAIKLGSSSDASFDLSTFTNTGTITGKYGAVLIGEWYSSSVPTLRVTNVNNSGTIASSSDVDFHAFINGGIITSFTNTGTITGVGASQFDIFNSGTITTLNNDQGGSDALTFTGVLPTNYNIIINSTSDYGKLAVTSGTGTMTFGIHSSSSVAFGNTYSSVLTGVSASKLTATSGTYTQSGVTAGFTLTSSDDSTWDLTWGTSAADTQAALRTYAKSIGAVFSQTIMAANYAHMNTYDCNVYGEDGSCFSVGSRTTRVDDPDTNSTSGVFNFGYKLSSSMRLGAFMDQTINNSAASGIKVDNKGPMVGLMAVWNQNPDTSGLQIKLGNTYQSKDVAITREIIGSAEPGKGNTSIETQSYLAELQYRFMASDRTMLQPYAAIRRTTVKQDAYTEEATVATPLTLAKLEDKTSTVIAGVKARHELKNMTYLKGALGIEHDVSHSKHDIQASGLSGLTNESFNNAEDKNRVVGSVGVDHYLSKDQVISANLHYQELAFKSTDSTSLYLNYSVGF